MRSPFVVINDKKHIGVSECDLFSHQQPIVSRGFCRSNLFRPNICLPWHPSALRREKNRQIKCHFLSNK